MTVSPNDFFKPWEKELSSLYEFLELLSLQAFRNRSNDPRVFAWRGVVNADWSLDSSLYRRMKWTAPSKTKEEDLAKLEAEVLADANRWGLHFTGRSHLPVLYELATLQHFAAPTRLLDVSFSPLVSLWFAVEDVRDDHGEPAADHADGRLFVFDVSGRVINEHPRFRHWEETYRRPWTGRTAPAGWSKNIWAWRPAPIEPRFAAQHGGFIFGGVPETGGIAWPKAPGSIERWKIAEVRACTSVALRFHSLGDGEPGRPPKNSSFTFRIPAEAKADIRNDLRTYFDLHAATIYPDHIGFATTGTPLLRRRP